MPVSAGRGSCTNIYTPPVSADALALGTELFDTMYVTRDSSYVHSLPTMDNTAKKVLEIPLSQSNLFFLFTVISLQNLHAHKDKKSPAQFVKIT